MTTKRRERRTEAADDPVGKLETGIPGFDLLSHGGLPKGRATLVAGTGGSGKTVLGAQFLAAGILHDDGPGVFVTFEEAPEEIRKNLRGLGWDVARWEAEGKWLFVDASPKPVDREVVAGSYDLGGLIARIAHAVRKTGAARVTVDSLGAVFMQFEDAAAIRGEMLRMAGALKRLGVTAIVTAEQSDEEGQISRFGVEELVADNVIIIRNVLEEAQRRRTLEILKFRGATHQKGEHPFTIVPGEGVVVIPLSTMKLTQPSSGERVSSGNGDLDRMCGGGFLAGSVILVSGETGTGKTLAATQFLAAPRPADERRLLLGFEESRDQIVRNARGWGLDLAAMERDGRLHVVCQYPEVTSIEDHLLRIRDAVEEVAPSRLAIDSLSSLRRVSTQKGFREFVVGLVSFLKDKGITSLVTATTPIPAGGSPAVDTHVSTITDSIILLRHVEMFGSMRRAIAVLKMRGSAHDRQVRELAIDGEGLHVGEAFRNVGGLLVGSPTYRSPEEVPPFDHFSDRDGETPVS